MVLDVSVQELIFASHNNGFMNYTYIGTCSGVINYDEPHVVKYVKFEELNKGSFGEFNKLVDYEHRRIITQENWIKSSRSNC